MDYLIGAGLALVVAVFAAFAGFDRDRAFYPTVLVVVAAYYDLFAVMGGSMPALGQELLATGVFVCLSVIGFRTSLWIVVIGLFGHGLFDWVHAGAIADPGVPAWWPGFCLSYDVVAAAWLAWLLLRPGRTGMRAAPMAPRDEPSRSPPSLGGFGRRIHPAVQRELIAAWICEQQGQPAEGFHHLERAHVLGQASTVEHVRVHARMLSWGWRRGDRREVKAQLLRLVAAATKTALKLVPQGNTGGSNVAPFRPMPVPADLAAEIAAAQRPSP